MKRRELLTLAGAVALTAASPRRRAWAQPKTVLKASDVHPEGYPTVQAVENMGKKLEQATQGRLGIQMYASMQLGGEKEAIEQAQVGALQFARVSVGALGPVVDDLNVFNLPFLFRNTEHMQKVIDGPIGQALLDKVTNNPQVRLVGLCWMDAGARNVYDSKKPIRTIEDLKGQKVRVMGNPMFVDMMNALGGNGVAMGYDQVFSALQTGVVDGADPAMFLSAQFTAWICLIRSAYLAPYLSHTGLTASRNGFLSFTSMISMPAAFMRVIASASFSCHSWRSSSCASRENFLTRP